MKEKYVHVNATSMCSFKLVMWYYTLYLSYLLLYPPMQKQYRTYVSCPAKTSIWNHSFRNVEGKKRKDLWLEHWTNNSLTSILSIILHLQEQIFTESASYVPNILCLKEKQNSCWSVYDRPCKVWVKENILANLSILFLPELQLS